MSNRENKVNRKLLIVMWNTRKNFCSKVKKNETVLWTLRDWILR